MNGLIKNGLALVGTVVVAGFIRDVSRETTNKVLDKNHKKILAGRKGTVTNSDVTASVKAD